VIATYASGLGESLGNSKEDPTTLDERTPLELLSDFLRTLSCHLGDGCMMNSKRLGNTHTAALGVSSAFVIHVRWLPVPKHGELGGRIEHVSTGQVAQFQNLEQMRDFVQRTLGSLDGARADAEEVETQG
jgi:hypothetical protein